MVGVEVGVVVVVVVGVEGEVVVVVVVEVGVEVVVEVVVNRKQMLFKPEIKPKGVIHIGGHRAEEQPWYDEIGVQKTLWVEAIEDSANWIKDHLKEREDIMVIHAAISNRFGYQDFYVTNNLASSSLLELKLHEEYYPKIKVTHTERVRATPLGYLMFSEGIDPKDYDMMNIDVQGHELEVLKGAGLKYIKWIYCEVNRAELYKGCAMVEEIDKYLAKSDFKRVRTEWTSAEWGDALYTK